MSIFAVSLGFSIVVLSGVLADEWCKRAKKRKMDEDAANRNWKREPARDDFGRRSIKSD